VLNRRRWVLAGIPVAALVALCSIASVSLFPLKVHSKRLGYAVAGVELYMAPPSGLVSNLQPRLTENVVTQAFALADEMSSPELRDLIASRAGIPAGRLAIDGPLDVDESIFALFPDGPKRASQIVVQNARYRITISEDTALPEISVEAQAPTVSEAVRLAAATQVAAGSYLSAIETRSRTPHELRLLVSPLGPISVSDKTKGVTNLAVLTFFLAFTLWAGLVTAALAIVRDTRLVRRGWVPGRVSP
jgi:hypothetical protein